MATGGRVLHYLRATLPDPRNTILFVGYQAAGTRGRQLVDGVKQVKMHGRLIDVHARIEKIDSMSAHADASEIVRWLTGFTRPPQITYLVHGEPPAQAALAHTHRDGTELEDPRACARRDGRSLAESAVHASTRQHPRTPGQHPRAPVRIARYLLERVGEAAVVQLYADGFERLSVRDKILCWHLYQAALAGRDIYYDQRYAHNLEMRAVLEAILRHPAGVDAQTLDAITHYTKLFWINTGPFNNLTARKFVPAFTPEALSAAVAAAVAHGARLPLARRRIGRRPAEAAAPAVLRSRLRVRSSPARRPGPAATSCRPAPTTSTWACRWPISKASTSATR